MKHEKTRGNEQKSKVWGLEQQEEWRCPLTETRKVADQA